MSDHQTTEAKAKAETGKVIADLHIHGCGFAMFRADGVVKHIPFEDVAIKGANDVE